MVTAEFKDMVIDHMNSGFLENIIDMLRHDTTLFALIPEMLKDERVRVRIGAIALIEELYKEFQKPLQALIPEFLALLEDVNPTIRGDALTALSYIYDERAKAHILKATSDANALVKDLAEELLSELPTRQFV